MTIHRFFVPPGTVRNERFPMPATIVHQVTAVLRLRPGSEVILLEGDGTEAHCRLGDAGGLTVTARVPAAGEPRHRLTAIQALLKGDHLEPVIRHGTELGIAAFQLVVTDRCVTREISATRLARLRAIAREAAEQSERGAVPPVEAPRSLVEAIVPGAVILDPRADAPRLGSVPVPTHVVIGPEGGFTAEELAAARQAGAVVASLGPRVLRSESVAVAAAAVILSRTGDFA